MVKPPTCPICKGKRPLCIHKSYPFVPRDLKKKITSRLSRELFGPSYSVFVGRMGYPNLYAGPLTGIDDIPGIDNPSEWFGLDYGKIIEIRSMLVRSKRKENIFSKSRFVQEQQEIAIAKRPPDTEIVFRRPPVYRLVLSESLQPMGPAGILEKMRIAENPKIDSKAEKIISDEIKAEESCFMLYMAGVDVYRISSILSSGLLGYEERKKLVPSRWATTAVHDIIAKNLMKFIRNFRQIEEYRVYSSKFLHNMFEILLIPGRWEFENFEAWAPGSNWSFFAKEKIIPEYEPYGGRKEYASLQAGGYYASRLGVCEALFRIKRQAKVVVFREVYEDYTVPVGVWQVLENVRNAFRQKFERFENIEEALDFINSRLRIPVWEYKKKSRILGRKGIDCFLK